VVYAANEEFQIAKQGLHNGILSIKAFVMAKFVLQIPYMILLALCALVVPAYAVGNFHMGGFLWCHVLMTAMIWCFECTGEALGIGIQNPLIGMLVSVMLWFSAFLFSGIFLKPDFIIWPFRICCYIFPLGWATTGMHYAESHGATWSGAELTQDGGFACPNLPAMQCFGQTGDQVRASLSSSYGNLKVEDTLFTDLLYLLIIAALWKIATVALIVVKMSWVHPLQPLTNEAASPDPAHSTVTAAPKAIKQEKASNSEAAPPAASAPREATKEQKGSNSEALEEI